MAGTDHARATDAADGLPGGGPLFVLTRPQLAENMGMAARAMLNCGLMNLRIVAPRETPTADKGRAAASGADAILDRAHIAPDLEAALSDCQYVLATTARRRDMVKPILDPPSAIAETRRRIAGGQRVAVVFGPERTGLDNDEVALADAICEVPLNPAFASLNLSQAVLVMAYEWSKSVYAGDAVEMPTAGSHPATRADLLNLFAHLERELDTCGFFRVPEKRAGMVRNLRNIFSRARLTEQEVRTLHGVIAELVTRRMRDVPDADRDDAAPPGRKLV